MPRQPAEPSQAGCLRVSLDELIGLRRQSINLATPGAFRSTSRLQGGHRSRLRGRGIDFDQVRPYQAGDDARTIDWRVTARTQVPHSRVFHEERDRPVFLVVEQSQRLYFGSALMLKSVLAARTAALLAWHYLGRGERVGGLVFGDQPPQQTKTQRGKHCLLQFLHHLQAFNRTLSGDSTATNSAHLAPAVKRARDVLQPGGLAIVLCDERALDEDAEGQLSLLAQQAELLLLPVYDRLDHQLPQAGRLSFVQGAAQLQLNTDEEDLRRAYQRLALERVLRWQRLARRLNARLQPLHTASNPLEQLAGYQLSHRSYR